MPRWSPVIRTEKSPLRIACSAWSNSCEGSGFPFVYGLTLARRRLDGGAEPRSLMIFPSAEGALESERVRAKISHDKIVRLIAKQAKYLSYYSYLAARIWPE
jgi:hypothetical protein